MASPFSVESSVASSFNRRTGLARAAALLAGAAAAPAWVVAAPNRATTTVEVTHAKGTTHVSAQPRKVVVYDLALLDAMHALQLPVAGVPRADFPPYLQRYADGKKYPAAGSLFEPDYEVLSQLRPDLILVASRSSARFETLSRIAPTLDLSVRAGHLLDDVNRNVKTLAALYGQPQRGEALSQLVRQEVEAVKPLAAKAGKGLLVLAINDRLSPQAPGSRFGLLHDVFGVPPALAANQLPARGQSFTMEDIARIDPDWIYVIDRNAATGSAPGGGAMIPSQKVFDNATIRATRAGQQGKLVFLDPKGWYLLGSAGPVAMINNARQIRAALEAAQKA